MRFNINNKNLKHTNIGKRNFGLVFKKETQCGETPQNHSITRFKIADGSILQCQVPKKPNENLYKCRPSLCFTYIMVTSTTSYL